MSTWLQRARAIGDQALVPNVPKWPKLRNEAPAERHFGDFANSGTGPLTFDERASILEYDGGHPCRWAEPMARLECDLAPARFTEKQWRQAIDDAGRFLDGWATEADRLGIEPGDILTGPLALVWRLRGRAVVRVGSDFVLLKDGSKEPIQAPETR